MFLPLGKFQARCASAGIALLSLAMHVSMAAQASGCPVLDTESRHATRIATIAGHYGCSNFLVGCMAVDGCDHPGLIALEETEHIRVQMVQLAWGWLHHQPNSELSKWYQRRFGEGKSRVRKLGIVALARKLLIALWKYLETGEIPAGAEVHPKKVVLAIEGVLNRRPLSGEPGLDSVQRSGWV